MTMENSSDITNAGVNLPDKSIVKVPGSSVGLHLWEMDEAELEAELQRQLDGMSCCEVQIADNGLSDSWQDENSASVVNSEVAQSTSTPRLKNADAHIGAGIAWSELMSSVDATSNHWSAFEDELAQLRQSLTSTVVKKNERNYLPVSENVSQSEISSDANDPVDEDVAQVLTSMQSEDIVQALQLATEGEDLRTPLSVTLKEHEQRPSFSETSSLTGASLRKEVDKIVQTHEMTLQDLAAEAREGMTDEETKWHEERARHEQELLQAIAEKSSLRVEMEAKLIMERNQLEQELAEREKIIQQEAAERDAEIEFAANKAAELRLARQANAERMQRAEEERLEALTQKLEETEAEEENLFLEVAKEIEERERMVLEAQIKWNMENRSARKIQRHYAEHRTRRRRRLLAIVVVQSFFRGLEGRKKAKQVRGAILTIQSSWRRALALCRCAAARQRQKSVLTLQRIWRGRCSRISTVRERRGLQTIQTWWRCQHRRRRYTRKRAAATTVACLLRRCIARQHVSRRQQALITLQAKFRSFMCRQHDLVSRRRNAMRTLQRYIRGHLGRVIATKRKQCLQCIQRSWRAYQRRICSIRICSEEAGLPSEYKLGEDSGIADPTSYSSHLSWTLDGITFEDENLQDDGNNLFPGCMRDSSLGESASDSDGNMQGYYKRWAGSAKSWANIFHNEDSRFSVPQDLSCFSECCMKNLSTPTSGRADQQKAEDEARANLKSTILKLAGKLRTCKERGLSDEAMQHFRNLRKLKEQYEAISSSAKKSADNDSRTFDKGVKNTAAADEQGSTELAGIQYELSVESLKSLPLEHFTKLDSKLVSLVANCNRLDTLSGLTDVAPHLRFLSARDNAIKQIDATSGLGSSIEHICLDMNRIDSLEAIGSAAPASLRVLKMANNSISSIDDLCEPIKNTPELRVPCPLLEVVSLYRNRISRIPDSLTHSLRWLRFLDLGRNHLTDIRNVDFRKCLLLQSLILYQNSISTPPSLGNVVLKELWLNGNTLKKVSFPADTWAPSLEILQLKDNEIESLEALPGMPMLRHLDLSFNEIQSFQELENLRCCPAMETLCLNDNPVAGHADYRREVICILPSLLELDGVPISEEERQAILTNRYASLTNVIMPCLEGYDDDSVRPFKVPTGGHAAEDAFKWKLNWSELLRGGPFKRKISTWGSGGDDGAMWTWQSFETMCHRHRVAREKLVRSFRRKGDAEDGSSLSSYPHQMLRNFAYDKEMRTLLFEQVKEHMSFNWDVRTRPDAHAPNITSSIHPLLDSAPPPAHEAGFTGVIADIRRPSRSREDRTRPLCDVQTASARAAIVFQSVFRGYSVRRNLQVAAQSTRLIQSRGESILSNGENRNSTRAHVHNDRELQESAESHFMSDSDSEYGAVDLDALIGEPPDLDIDEFDFMQRNMGLTESAPSPAGNNGEAKHQQASYDGVRVAFLENSVAKSADSNSQAHEQAIPEDPSADLDVARRRRDEGEEESCPPTPASSSSSIQSAQYPLSIPSTPIYEKRERSKRREHQRNIDTVAQEWGFTDRKTAAAVLNRRSRLTRAQRERQRKKKMQDPEYKYRVLMRRVQENKERENSSSGSPSHQPGSARYKAGPSSATRRPVIARSGVQRDRANHRRNRKHKLPAWAASRERKSFSSEGERAGGAYVNAWAQNADASKSHSSSTVESLPPISR